MNLKVPLGLVDGNGKPINKGKIYISNTGHPAVPLAYLRQFQKDFSLFLKSRSAELRSGGRIVVLILGRRTDDHSDKSATVLWELLDQSLAIMVSQVSATLCLFIPFSVHLQLAGINEFIPLKHSK